MCYYLIVTGHGKARRILTYCRVRQTAVQMLDRAIFDHGFTDARLIVTKIEPPRDLYFKALEDAK